MSNSDLSVMEESSEVEIVDKPFPEQIVSNIFDRIDEAQPDELREKAKELTRSLSIGYFELGGVLWKVRSFNYYKDYGYSSFEEYVQEELDFKKRKAMYLSSIWQKFRVELGLNAEDLRGIGWSKAKEIKSIIDQDNYEEWLDRARRLPRPELSKKVKEANGKKTEEKYRKSFTLVEEQKENVETALEIAKEKAGSDKQGHLLDLICTFYLSNYLDDSKKELNWIRKQIESTFDVKVMVFTEESSYEKVSGLIDKIEKDE